MASTFADLVTEVSQQLHSYTAEQEIAVTLKSAVGTTDLSLSLDDAGQISRGLVEIDDELVYVSSTDKVANTAVIPPWGRGMYGTTAAAHSLNARVLKQPRFPRQRIKKTINEAILGVYPDLFAVKTDESSTVNPVVVTYPVPTDCDLILEIKSKALGPSQMWREVTRWKLDTRADTTSFPTGRCVDLYSLMHPGQPIKITYVAQPSTLANDTDLFSLTGLPESSVDVITMGATARMLQELENVRVQLNAVEQGERATLVQAGAASNASRSLLGLYAQRLDAERRRLLAVYPIALSRRV